MKTRPNPSSKPYYRCLNCVRFGASCGGHSTRDMTAQEWCEYMRDIIDVKRLKYANIASTADISIKTVERIMALNCDKDIKRETARRIELAVIGTSNQYPCYLDYEDTTAFEQLEKLRDQLEYLRKDNERKAKIIDKYLQGW